MSLFKSLGPTGNSMFVLYDEQEWKDGNQNVYNLADGDCSRAEAVFTNTQRLKNDIEGNADKKVKDVEKQLDLRLSDLDFWKGELDEEVAKLQRSTDLLTRLKTRLNSAKISCDLPAATCREVIVRRDTRKGMEMVNDDAQRQLMKYLSLLYDVSSISEKNIADIEEHQRANGATTNMLMRDIEDKFSTICIDNSANTMCRDIGKPERLHFNSELLKITPKTVTLSTWDTWTKENIEKSEMEVNRSDKFRPLVEQILKQTFGDLDLQRRKVLKAFRDRLKELSESQKKLELRVARIGEQILEQKCQLDGLELSKDDMLSRLGMCQKILLERSGRPGMELVKDGAQVEIDRQVSLWTTSLHKLNDQIDECRATKNQLEQTQLGLEKQIE